ncbi:unnamed protein product [Haemonchus placei]|uniref:Uncharacterized protein n=1 Tax=Haemonchus placei TaxID=6290 RepID=A0A0N4W2B4_HAEPC|nr:unnamed protein product [Haemonchus placei]
MMTTKKKRKKKKKKKKMMMMKKKRKNYYRLLHLFCNELPSTALGHPIIKLTCTFMTTGCFIKNDQSTVTSDLL